MPRFGVSSCLLSRNREGTARIRDTGIPSIANIERNVIKDTIVKMPARCSLRIE